MLLGIKEGGGSLGMDFSPKWYRINCSPDGLFTCSKSSSFSVWWGKGIDPIKSREKLSPPLEIKTGPFLPFQLRNELLFFHSKHLHFWVSFIVLLCSFSVCQPIRITCGTLKTCSNAQVPSLSHSDVFGWSVVQALDFLKLPRWFSCVSRAEKFCPAPCFDWDRYRT